MYKKYYIKSCKDRTYPAPKATLFEIDDEQLIVEVVSLVTIILLTKMVANE